MRLRSQQRGKPSPNFSLEKINKKRKAGRKVSIAAVQRAVAAAAVPLQVPPPPAAPTPPTPVAAPPQPAALQLPAWQPRVVLRDIFTGNSPTTACINMMPRVVLRNVLDGTLSPPPAENEVPRKVQTKRKSSDNDGPSSKRRKVSSLSSLASVSEPLLSDEGYDASDEYSSERSSPIPETLFLASQMEQMEESEEEGLSLEDVAEEQQDRPMALEDGAVVEEEEEGLKFMFKPFREAMKRMKERERRRLQEFQNR